MPSNNAKGEIGIHRRESWLGAYYWCLYTCRDNDRQRPFRY